MKFPANIDYTVMLYKKKMFVAADVVVLFLVYPIRSAEDNLHNIVNKRVKFTCIKLVTLIIWSDHVVTQAAEFQRLASNILN